MATKLMALRTKISPQYRDVCPEINSFLKVKPEIKLTGIPNHYCVKERKGCAHYTQ